MINNIDKNLVLEISASINEWLNYIDGRKIRLVCNKFNLAYADRYDYGAMMDNILFYCNDNLNNSIMVLNFINNDFK